MRNHHKRPGADPPYSFGAAFSRLWICCTQLRVLGVLAVLTSLLLSAQESTQVDAKPLPPDRTLDLARRRLPDPGGAPSVLLAGRIVLDCTELADDRMVHMAGLTVGVMIKAPGLGEEAVLVPCDERGYFAFTCGAGVESVSVTGLQSNSYSLNLPSFFSWTNKAQADAPARRYSQLATTTVRIDANKSVSIMIGGGESDNTRPSVHLLSEYLCGPWEGVLRQVVFQAAEEQYHNMGEKEQQTLLHKLKDELQSAERNDDRQSALNASWRIFRSTKATDDFDTFLRSVRGAGHPLASCEGEFISMLKDPNVSTLAVKGVSTALSEALQDLRNTEQQCPKISPAGTDKECSGTNSAKDGLAPVQGSQVAEDSLGTGLVAYYPLDGTASDASGHARNGAVRLVAWQAGANGQAARFDGQSASIEITQTDGVQAPQFSVCAWVKVVGEGNDYQHFVSISQNDGRSLKGFCLAWCKNEGNKFSFWTASGQSDNHIYYGPVQNGTWYHLAGVYDGIGKRFYVNGTLVGRSEAAFAPSPTPLGIGYMPGVGNFLNGNVADVRIYNRPLSDAEVERLSKRH